MARKIRFSLDMENGVEVRTLEELRENFSLEKLLQHIVSGKLVTWLRDRYLDDIANKIEAIDTSDSDYNQRICEIFDVSYDDTSEADYEKAEEHNRRLSLLKAISYEQEYIDNVDKMAFEQDDIYDLLDDGKTTIYLCGEQFSIPLSKNGVTYIGVNNPVAVIDSKELVDFEAKSITIKNMRYDDKYRSLESTVSKESEISNNDYEIQELKQFLLEKIQESAAMSDEEIDEMLSKSSYITAYKNDAIKRLLESGDIRKGVLDSNQFLYINNTPFGEQIETVVIEL